VHAANATDCKVLGSTRVEAITVKLPLRVRFAGINELSLLGLIIYFNSCN